MSKVLVIGAGAAGSMAAVFAAKNGNEVIVFEKNAKTGKKIYITGKGRCNITNAVENTELIKNTIRNPKFMYSAYSTFTSEDVIKFFETLGCPVKIERGNRVFPVSDRSSDVIKALDKAMEQEGVRVRYNTPVESLVVDEDGTKIIGIKLRDGKVVEADKVIVATGGLSYKSTGSTGDGYEFAKQAGHEIKELRPSLVALLVKEKFIKDLEGLSLKNVRVSVKNGKKTLFDELGEMLFTRNGVSGPLILSVSSIAGDLFYTDGGILNIDLKPALSEEELDTRLLRDFNEFKAKELKNALDKLLPKSLIPVFLERTGINVEKKAGILTKVERSVIIDLLKHFTLQVTGLKGYEEAVITKGGVSVKEINPKTMESKKIKGLYFAGEVLDVDALTGGFNLQIAWSTGAVAGSNVLE
ncbi:MAG: NAD(P)/FAD-dependent oxidoreductase [Catonella sp.]|uniref:NAD(P)/FAD-dependent oxidoreductase n=1 Tax=Catonella sp. TaxID=2382125 RepID=UPI003F9F0AA4